jgi:hypothetical protein
MYIHTYIHTCIHVYIEDVPITTFLAGYLTRYVSANAGFLCDKFTALFTDINALLCDKGD